MDLNHLRSAHHNRFLRSLMFCGPHTPIWRTLLQRKKSGSTSLTPPENGAGEVSGPENIQHPPRRIGFPCIANKKIPCSQCTYTCENPKYTSKMIGNRHSNCVCKKRVSDVLRSVRPLEDDADDESEDGTNSLDLPTSQFPTSSRRRAHRGRNKGRQR